MVQPTHKRTETDIRLYVPNTVVRVVGSGHIVNREKHARDGLQEEQKQRGRPEHINPACAPGYRFIQKTLFEGAELQPGVEPLVKA